MIEGLSCEIFMPLAWRAEPLPAQARLSHMREAAHLLAALNQIESMHEQEAGSPENRRLDRIEAKLDLTLHLLARTLEIRTPETSAVPAARNVLLTPSEAQWPDPSPPAQGTPLIVEFRPSEALPISLELPAIALEPQAGTARARFDELTEALDEALYQFVFRRHRQAIRARTI